jgi:hypothetical protein
VGNGADGDALVATTPPSAGTTRRVDSRRDSARRPARERLAETTGGATPFFIRAPGARPKRARRRKR